MQPDHSFFRRFLSCVRAVSFFGVQLLVRLSSSVDIFLRFMFYVFCFFKAKSYCCSRGGGVAADPLMTLVRPAGIMHGMLKDAEDSFSPNTSIGSASLLFSESSTLEESPFPILRWGLLIHSWLSFVTGVGFSILQNGSVTGHFSFLSGGKGLVSPIL